MIEVIFLGTGGSMPTKKRNLPCVLVKRDGELLMFDCGEGAQRQLTLVKAGVNKKMKIFVSHMHGDHVLGLPGLIQTMALLGRSRELWVYGPRGIKAFLNCVQETVPFNLTYEIKLREVEEGVVARGEGYAIEAAWVDHTIPCLAFALVEDPRPGKFNPARARRLGVPEGPLWKKLQMGEPVEVGGRRVEPREVLGPQRPGAKVVYSADTRPCRSVEKLSRNADLLIFDSTFDEGREDKAGEYGHSTCVQAAKVAKKAGARRLALTHISPIYEGEEEKLVKQARKIFKKVFLAEDLMKVEVKPPARAAPAGHPQK